jgi:hypothetical protein
MKKDRLQRLICDQVSRFGELLERGGRPPHWHNNPAHPRFEHDPRLIDIFRVILIDRCECDDCADMLAFKKPSQRSRPLPGSSDHLPRYNDCNSLLYNVVPPPHQSYGSDQQKKAYCEPPSTRHQYPSTAVQHSSPEHPFSSRYQIFGADCIRSLLTNNPNPFPRAPAVRNSFP